MSSERYSKRDSSRSRTKISYAKDLTKKNLQKIFKDSLLQSSQKNELQSCQKKEVLDLRILAREYLKDIESECIQQRELEYQQKIDEIIKIQNARKLLNDLKGFAESQVKSQNNICMDQVETQHELSSRRSNSPEKNDDNRNILKVGSFFDDSLNHAFLEENTNFVEDFKNVEDFVFPMLNYDSFGIKHFESIEIPQIEDKENQIKLISLLEKKMESKDFRSINDSPVKFVQNIPEFVETNDSPVKFVQNKLEFVETNDSPVKFVQNKPESVETVASLNDLSKLKFVLFQNNEKPSISTKTKEKNVEIQNSIPNSDEKDKEFEKAIENPKVRTLNMLSSTQLINYHHKKNEAKAQNLHRTSPKVTTQKDTVNKKILGNVLSAKPNFSNIDRMLNTIRRKHYEKTGDQK